MTFHYNHNDKAFGPIDTDALAAKLRSGELPADTLVCETGATEWKPAGEYPELQFSPNIEPMPPKIQGGASDSRFDMSGGTESAQAVEVLQSREGSNSKAEVIAYTKLSGSNEIDLAKDIYSAYRAGMRLKQVRVTLNNGEMVMEAGALHYMRGNLDIEAKSGGVGKWFKSLMSGESSVKPRYRGTGIVHLEPTFRHFLFVDVQKEKWIVDQGMFYASEGSVSVDGVMQSNLSSAVAGGEGLFQTQLTGNGWAVLSSPVPHEEIIKISLNNEKLQVDGNFALARRGNINFTVEKSTKGIIGSVRGGEGLLQTFTGTGEVWLAPTESVYQKLKLLRGIGPLANAQGSRGTKT